MNTKLKLSRFLHSSSSSSLLPNILKTGLTPTLKDYTRLLLFLKRNHRFSCSIHFFSQMKANQVEGDSCACSIFTWALLRQRRFGEAEHFMRTQMTKLGNCSQNRLWDSLIRGLCVHENDPEKALLVLRDCLNAATCGTFPSSFTLSSLIYSFCSRGMMSEAVEVLELMSDEKLRYPFRNFVCSSIISEFCKIGKPEVAVSFYEHAASSGALRPNLVTYTALLSALCKMGRFDEASSLARGMEHEGLAFDVIFYSCWICGYLKEGLLVEAFDMYRVMVGKGISSDTISYTLLIDGLSKEGNVEKAVGFLHSMRKDGLEANLVTYTTLMLGFCKKGKLEEACLIFNMAEDLGLQADEFMYATLIDAFSRKGDFDRVHSLLNDMEKKGIHPSIVTYNIIINGLCKAGKTVEADKVSKGVPADLFTYSTLLHGYIKEGNILGVLDMRRRVEEAKVHLDIVMCNILIKALFMVGEIEAAYSIYKGMPEMSLTADSVTYGTMVDGFCKLRSIERALEIFDDFRRTSISSVACYNHIIHGLCTEGMVDMATDVFVELIEKGLDVNVRTYKLLLKVIFKETGVEGVLKLGRRFENSGTKLCDIILNDAICFLCRMGFVDAACSVFMALKRSELAATPKSYYSLLKGLMCDGKIWLAHIFLSAFLKEFGINEPKVRRILVRYLCMRDATSIIHLIDNMKDKNFSVPLSANVCKALTKDGRALDAYDLVLAAKDTLPVMDVVDYSIIVHGLCRGGHFMEALDLCALAKKKGVTFNIVTYNSLIKGLCCQGCIIEALRLFDSLEKINVVPSGITYATLIDNLSKEGYLPKAKELLEVMVLKGLNPNTRVYNSLIDSYCKLNRIKEAWQLLVDLESRHLEPDAFTISSIINGYYQIGDLEGALGFFYQFKSKSLLPDFLGFLQLLRGLCSKGRMEEARCILREMLGAPSVVVLLEKVDAEIKPESVKSFLTLLCDQGSIQEAITILNEVGCRFFPVKTRFNDGSGSKMDQYSYRTSGTVHSMPSTIFHEIDLECTMKSATKEDLETAKNLRRKSQFNDFSSLYSLTASLCSRGDIQEANRLAKEIISSLDNAC